MQRLSLSIVLCCMLLSGCALKAYPINNQSMSQDDFKRVEYAPHDDRYSENQYNPTNFHIPDHKDSVAVLTSESFGDNPNLLKAYQLYLATGQASNVKGKGIETLAYNPYDMPLLSCAPLQLCQIILAKKEKINDITLGDPTRWEVSSSYMGDKQHGTGSWVVELKPSVTGIATNLTITTNQRIYRLAILSKEGVTSQTINYWYPNDTLSYVTDQAKMHHEEKTEKNRNVISNNIDADHVNLDYSFTSPNSPKPVWLPVSIFDNGKKTFIKLPEISGSFALPNFYISSSDNDGKESVVNYRYKKPYIIYDGLFDKAVLLSGKGSGQLRVNLINNAYPQK